jgi:hypothetical protein
VDTQASIVNLDHSQPLAHDSTTNLAHPCTHASQPHTVMSSSFDCFESSQPDVTTTQQRLRASEAYALFALAGKLNRTKLALSRLLSGVWISNVYNSTTRSTVKLKKNLKSDSSPSCASHFALPIVLDRLAFFPRSVPRDLDHLPIKM